MGLALWVSGSEGQRQRRHTLRLGLCCAAGLFAWCLRFFGEFLNCHILKLDFLLEVCHLARAACWAFGGPIFTTQTGGGTSRKGFEVLPKGP